MIESRLIRRNRWTGTTSVSTEVWKERKMPIDKKNKDQIQFQYIIDYCNNSH